MLNGLRINAPHRRAETETTAHLPMVMMVSRMKLSGPLIIDDEPFPIRNRRVEVPGWVVPELIRYFGFEVA